jgi:hypothetical protein
MTDASAQRTTRALGYAGLIPFVLAAAVAQSGSAQAQFAIELANAYALAIICFLCGSWWGTARLNESAAALLLSNAYLLLALGLYLFARDWWALAAALLLAGAWLLEHNGRLLPGYPRDYRRMRGILTLLAGTSMALVQLA